MGGGGGGSPQYLCRPTSGRAPRAAACCCQEIPGHPPRHQLVLGKSPHLHTQLDLMYSCQATPSEGSQRINSCKGLACVQLRQLNLLQAIRRRSRAPASLAWNMSTSWGRFPRSRYHQDSRRCQQIEASLPDCRAGVADVLTAVSCELCSGSARTLDVSRAGCLTWVEAL